MSAPNDVSIARVYTRKVGGAIADTSFDSDEKFEVVVEAEAGSAIHGTGAPYQIGIAVRNLTDSSTTVHNLEEDGTFGTAGEWENLAYEEVFGPFSPVPGDFQQGVHCYEIIAYVRARKTDPDVSFAKSPVFL